MKTIKIILLAVLPGLFPMTGSVAFNEIKEEHLIRNTSDSILIDIQDKIYDGFVEDMMSQETQNLDQINSGLNAISSSNAMAVYWLAYSDYYRAIYHLKFGDLKNAEQIMNRGIDRLRDKSNKNSEDYALLALMQGLTIQFLPSSAVKIAEKMGKNAEHAYKLDKNNPRAHYVLASNDFYKPAQYGGGQICESHLKKAISLSESELVNPVMPNWGGEEAYEMLVKFLIREDRKDEAKDYFKKGLEAYPDSYVISSLGQKLNK